jgi:SAM-dependent methyltransferase
MSSRTKDEVVKDAVREAYGSIARRVAGRADSESCCAPAAQVSCCAPAETASCCASAEQPERACSPAVQFYASEEVAGLPASVTGASLGCGNPVAISELQSGETVLDLGSGGGIDCFLAAQQVGPEGHVIGLDVTPDMIKLARHNARQMGLANVDFRFGEMEDIPLPSESVDVIISNCVINLSPDKDAVFAEAYRVLRPGGRMNVSDIVLRGELPESVRDRLDAWAGCVAGALEETDYLNKIRAAGFEDLEVLSRDGVAAEQVAQSDDVQALVMGADGQLVEGADAADQLAQAGISVGDIAAKIVSIKVRVRKRR